MAEFVAEDPGIAFDINVTVRYSFAGDMVEVSFGDTGGYALYFDEKARASVYRFLDALPEEEGSFAVEIPMREGFDLYRNSSEFSEFRECFREDNVDRFVSENETHGYGGG